MALVILHLSDLHFGPHSRFAEAEPDDLGRRFCAELDRALDGRAAPDLVICTGDLTESARKQEFEAAQLFFEAFVGALGLERRRFCFVPGNHDVSWAHCKRVRINQEIEEFDDGELARRIQAEKMVPWERFVASFFGDSASERRSLELGVVVRDFPELELAVAGLDSCTRETDQRHGGFIGEGQAQALMSEWSRDDRRAWLKLIAVHHNPVADNEDNLREWVGWLGEQAEAGGLSRGAIEHFAADATGFAGKGRLHAIAEDTHAQLVVHGHVHAAGHTPWSWRRGLKGQTQVVGAGSWGLAEHKLPGEQPVMFQLLELDPAARELRVHRRVWEPRARAPGQVRAGSFVADPASPVAGIVVDVGLPAGFEQRAEVAPAAPEPTPLDQAFLTEYRMRLGGRHRSWELGTVHMGARRPATPALDEMYVPLRLGPRREREGDRQLGGETITPYRIMQRHRNLLIRGAAGSGKTTWMRWSFRRLLERDDALPILIELRELARQWSQPGATGRQRNFDWWLEQWVERFVGGGWSEALRAALNSPTGPRPVLMVDGWDELGDLGREFREQFDGFLAAHPRVLAIATSRPYGEQVPEYDDQFETVEIQALSDPEITTLVRLFFTKVHAGSEAEVEDEVERFCRALGAAEQAKSLGRTPLLLVMMLIIGRGRPLPDRRHKLYEFCIEQLLDAHPSKRIQDGAQVASWQWAPAGYDARLRAVAKIALWMHETRERESAGSGRAAVAPREELVEQLPSSWSTGEKAGFLAWLVASSGLMVDYSDDALSFAHLGFQEYLAAWQLEVDCEGDEARAELCTRLGEDLSWWETLRLWAALVEGRVVERLDPVLRELSSGTPAGFWLAGAMLADGLGGERFDAWLARLPAAEFALGYPGAATAADAWRVSRQLARRETIAACLDAQVSRATWLDWWRLDRWYRRASLDGRLRWPPAEQPAGIVVRSLDKLEATAPAIAWGRIWMASSPLWSGKQLELLALRLWPNHRMWTGMLIQTLLAATDEVEVERAAAWLWGECRRRAPPEELVRDYTRRYLERVRDHELDDHALLAREQARYVASFDLVDVSPHARQRIRPVVRGLGRGLDRAHIIASDLARESAKQAAHWRDAMPGESVCDWSLGFVGVRAMFADAPDDDPLVRLLAKAARLSLHNAGVDDELAGLVAGFGGDPLWPALARVLVRASTAADRELLESLATDPEQRGGVLGLGLRYWVRGDVMLADGSSLRLEQLGQALPVLDAVPLELR